MQILSWLAPWRAQVTFVRPALLDGHAAAGLPAEADHRAPERLDAHGPDRAPLCPGGIDNRLHGSPTAPESRRHAVANRTEARTEVLTAVSGSRIRSCHHATAWCPVIERFLLPSSVSCGGWQLVGWLVLCVCGFFLSALD